MRRSAILAPGVATVAVLAALPPPLDRARAATEPASDAAHCLALPTTMAGAWPDPSTRILSVRFDPGSPGEDPRPGSPMPSCSVIGVIGERVGAGGQAYAIHFHLRLPTAWNGRFLFQGGAGSNGELRDPRGPVWVGVPDALSRGFAVVSQDAGHDNAVNTDPTRAGPLAFGFDPQARADYGHASLPRVAAAAKAALARYYGRAARYSYFVGCSKGGQEGLQSAERYPDLFDGIVAGAPALSLPRAAVAEAWDTQTFARLAGPEPSLERLAASFSDADLRLVAAGVLAACDSRDGLADGMVSDPRSCTTARVAPQLEKRRCRGGKTAQCLAPTQVAALERSIRGARDGRGRPLYAAWPWDPGIAASGWRVWKIGGPMAQPPALNVVLGAASLATVFTTPPTAVPGAPEALLAYQMGFDFDRDAPRIYARDQAFPRSGWEDISARSTDLSAFRARGGKLIVPHGAADPVFSLLDTLDWWRAVDRRYGGQARSFVRVFPVPGMNHCGGGPATDRFDPLESLMAWVEDGRAPDEIVGRAGPDAPWPGRTRPLCAYPAVARYRGGDPERAESFACQGRARS